jgi:hypothetical protein
MYGNYGNWPIGKDGQYHPSQVHFSAIDFTKSSTPIDVQSLISAYALREFLEYYMKIVLKK